MPARRRQRAICGGCAGDAAHAHCRGHRRARLCRRSAAAPDDRPRAKPRPARDRCARCHHAEAARHADHADRRPACTPASRRSPYDGGRIQSASRASADRRGPGPGQAAQQAQGPRRRVEQDRVRRARCAEEARPRGDLRRRRQRSRRHPSRHRPQQAAHRLQSGRAVRRSAVLRPARGQLPGAAQAEVYGLQSARPDPGARQGADQEDPRLPPPARGAVRGVSSRARRSPSPRASSSRCSSNR